MKTKRLKGNILNKILITLILLVLVSTLILTLAYFQDKKEYSGTLDFGNIKLKVSGDSVQTGSSKLNFSVDRTGVSYQTGGKIMPGDIVNIKLSVALESTSEPAYYIVNISDEKNVFENAFYYSQNGTDVYVNNGEKIVKQNTTTEETSKKVGKLTAGDSNAHNIAISAKIDENFDEQAIQTTVQCKIFAIQQANLNETEALTELLLNSSTEANKKVYTKVEYLESTGPQFINSKYKPTSEILKYELDYEITTDFYSFIGNASDDDLSFGIHLYNGRFYVGTGRALLGYNFTQNTLYKLSVEANNGNLTLIQNGVTTSKTYTGSLYKNSEIGIFRAKTDTGWSQPSTQSKIYFCKIYDNNILVRDFIPCVRNSDNKPGLYDAVSGMFFTNSGQSEFLWG